MIKKIISRVIGRLLTARINAAVHAEVEHSLLYRHRVFGSSERLILAPSAIVHNALFNTLSGLVIIEEGVCFGHSVSVLTGTHNADATGREREDFPTLGCDIVIKRGVWIASNATILGPCIIGEDAVVAACSLVRNDVPPRTIVAGVPAKIIRKLAQETDDAKSLELHI
jgi:acetyltransferase-like isoleucine patch superfamily enzyme